MVTILPPKTNVGTQIGQSLGQGVQSGMQQGFQRGLLQQALGKVRGLAGQENVKPLDLMLGLMEAGAGIPGSERYLSSLLPMLLSNARAQELYGKEGAGIGGTASALTPAQASKEASKIIQEGQEAGGFLSPPMNPEQMQEYAQQYALTLNDPAAFDRGLAQAQALNQSKLQSRQSFEDAARGMGITDQEMPRYLQVATEFQNLKDPATINRSAFKKFQEIRNNKEALRNLSVPGIGRTALQATGGLLGNLLAGKEGRQDYLKRYDQLVRKLVNQGEEPYVRSELSKLGLSPTEIEARIHPLTEANEKAISALPLGNKMNPQARQNALVNFFRKNVDNETSLLVLRNQLIKDKKYDWKEVADAINQAFPEGRNLTDNQSSELVHLGQAPKDSLIDIFRTGNVLDYLRGKI